MSHTLPLRHALLALAVVAVWGTNFVVIKAALAALPPLLLATLRFALAFLPAALFVARPALPWRTLAAYGVLIGAGQFGLLFVAMRADCHPERVLDVVIEQAMPGPSANARQFAT
jgi:O-acetylserine/cysteine efflux transporter